MDIGVFETGELQAVQNKTANNIIDEYFKGLG